MTTYGIKYKSTKTNKWVWHLDYKGKEIREFSKERAEQLSNYWDSDLVKVTRIVKKKRKKKKT